MGYFKMNVWRFHRIGQLCRYIDMERKPIQADAKGTVVELTRKTLKEMADADLLTADPSVLTDLRDITIDPSWPVRKKLQAFAEQAGNLYMNKIGEYVVKVRFQESGATIDEKMEEYLELLARNMSFKGQG